VTSIIDLVDSSGALTNLELEGILLYENDLNSSFVSKNSEEENLDDEVNMDELRIDVCFLFNRIFG
jgi:hypothetical protein